jgi:hypothetical protein
VLSHLGVQKVEAADTGELFIMQRKPCMRQGAASMFAWVMHLLWLLGALSVTWVWVSAVCSAMPDVVQVPRKCKVPRVKGGNNKRRGKQWTVVSEPVSMLRGRWSRRVLSLLLMCMLTICGAVGAGMVVAHAPVVQHAVNAVGVCWHGRAGPAFDQCHYTSKAGLSTHVHGMWGSFMPLSEGDSPEGTT